MTDINLLELLYNGYYPRNETNAIARERLAAMSLSERMEQAAKADLSTLSQEDLYTAVCAKIISSPNIGSNLPSYLQGISMQHLDIIFDKISPYFFCEVPRIVYLGFDRFEELHWVFFSSFGEEELPIALSHCHLKQLKYVMICISADCLDEKMLIDGIRYYLKKVEYCPRIWDLSGILLFQGNEYAYLSLHDERVSSGGML